MSKIEIKHTVLGTHRWSECPIEEVAFLKNEHHHDFTIRVTAEVNHDDRALEFIMFRIQLMKTLEKHFTTTNYIIRFGDMSCEMISEKIRRHLNELYYRSTKLRKFNYNFKVNVSEDETYRGGEW